MIPHCRLDFSLEMPNNLRAMLSKLTPYRSIIVVVGSIVVFIATATFLHLEGRRWWCSCARPIPWSLDIHSTHNSQHVFDPYTFSHILHGVIFFGVLWPLREKISTGYRFLIACALEAAWELVENSPFVIERYRSATASLNYTGDSVINSLADIGWCALGFVIARYIGLKWSIAMFFVFEIGCLMWVRDNLTLNVIMLFYPIQAIKTWQAG
jgi:Protein of unknown function (DUF2585)